MDLICPVRQPHATITCPCQFEKSWHLFLAYQKAHTCVENCTDPMCKELVQEWRRVRDEQEAHVAIYFSLEPFKNEQQVAPWKRQRNWAVFGNSKRKKPLWTLCDLCSHDVEIDKTKVAYHPNGYRAEWRKHPKNRDMTFYFPFDTNFV